MSTKNDWWREWAFPELSSTENAIVAVARKRGYASFFPAYPDAHSQAHSTLRGAIQHLGIDRPEGYFTPSPIAQEINGLRLEIEVEELSRMKSVSATPCASTSPAPLQAGQSDTRDCCARCDGSGKLND